MPPSPLGAQPVVNPQLRPLDDTIRSTGRRRELSYGVDRCATECGAWGTLARHPPSQSNTSQTRTRTTKGVTVRRSRAPVPAGRESSSSGVGESGGEELTRRLSVWSEEAGSSEMTCPTAPEVEDCETCPETATTDTSGSHPGPPAFRFRKVESPDRSCRVVESTRQVWTMCTDPASLQFVSGVHPPVRARARNSVLIRCVRGEPRPCRTNLTTTTNRRERRIPPRGPGSAGRWVGFHPAAGCRIHPQQGRHLRRVQGHQQVRSPDR